MRAEGGDRGSSSAPGRALSGFVRCAEATKSPAERYCASGAACASSSSEEHDRRQGPFGAAGSVVLAAALRWQAMPSIPAAFGSGAGCGAGRLHISGHLQRVWPCSHTLCDEVAAASSSAVGNKPRHSHRAITARSAHTLFSPYQNEAGKDCPVAPVP